MMKIEFRAWDGKKMHRVDAINFNPYLDEPYVVVQTGKTTFKSINFSKIELMQSTGLEDKYGYMLRDWKESKGACIELGYAIAKDMQVIFQE